MNNRCIVIGAGHAAAQLVASLRQESWAGSILMVGDEPALPYHRPPLSKGLLTNEKTADELAIRPAAFYEKHDITFRQSRVSRIDRTAHTVTLADGETIPYEKLALCLGSRVRRLDIPGADLPGVHYLRTIADVNGIKAGVAPTKRAVIIGGGYIGLETAAGLKKLGMEVTVLEAASRVLQRVTAPEVSAFYSRVHAEEGVTIHCDVAVAAIEGTGRAEKVVCRDGRSFEADLVIIGVGVLPNVELAVAAGLTVDNGIVLDSQCRSSDPDIVAAGDCSNQFSALYGRRLRLESVPNAMDQAKVAAATICGIHKESSALPWFWSDQYDMKLQIAGLNAGFDQVVIRGETEGSRSFAAFYYREGQLCAADCINRPQEFMLSKRLLAAHSNVRPTLLADDTLPVKALMDSVKEVA